MQKNEVVIDQYRTADALKTRMEFQGRYSVNKYGFSNWLMDQYEFPENASVLEVGCGTGGMWAGREELVSGFSKLVLTDFSDGMLAEARKNLSGLTGTRFLRADIRDLPFEADSFDFVIANMMLYHVDDKPKALSEVRRVLRPGGAFVCATYGLVGVPSYLRELLSDIASIRMPDTSFTLQNGESILKAVFSRVERREYEDRFEVDDADALLRYLLSMEDFLLDASKPFPLEEAREAIQRRIREEGSLRIPKEYGTFLSK